jgi:hypothetical protein
MYFFDRPHLSAYFRRKSHPTGRLIHAVSLERQLTGEFWSMRGKVILDSGSDPEPVDRDSLSEYHGRRNFERVRSIEAVVDTRDCTLSILRDFFPNLERL